MSPRLMLPVLLVGCATAGPLDPSGNAQSDGSISVVKDSSSVVADAPKVFMDACVPTQVELLKNPAFDLTPMGTNWVETPIDPAYPLVTDDNGGGGTLVAKTAPYKAFLGGLAASSGHAIDSMYQEFTVPASATSLVLTGFYWVATGESGSTVYDNASIALTQTNGTSIEAVKSFTNAGTTTTWTAFNHTFTNISAGQTVRVFMTSSNDTTLPTSFLFDSLSLQAMACP